jgi:hypothetical protein
MILYSTQTFAPACDLTNGRQRNRKICTTRRIRGRLALCFLHSLSSSAYAVVHRIRHRTTDMLRALRAGNRGSRMGPHVCRRQKLHQRHISANKVRALRPLMRHRRTGFVDHLISEIATSHEFAREILSKKSVYLTSKC